MVGGRLKLIDFGASLQLSENFGDSLDVDIIQVIRFSLKFILNKNFCFQGTDEYLAPECYISKLVTGSVETAVAERVKKTFKIPHYF